MPGIKRPAPDSDGENHPESIPPSQRRALLSILTCLVAIHGANEASVACLEAVNRQIEALNAAQAAVEDLLWRVARLNLVNPFSSGLGGGLTSLGGFQLIRALWLRLGCILRWSA